MTIDPLCVFQFGEGNRMYVHGHEVVFTRDAERLREAMVVAFDALEEREFRAGAERAKEVLAEALWPWPE